MSPRLRNLREWREQTTTQWGVEPGHRGRLKLRRQAKESKAVSQDHGADSHHAYAWSAVAIGAPTRRCAACGVEIGDGELSISPLSSGYPFLAEWHVAWHVRHAPWSMLLRQPRGAFSHRTGAGRTKVEREMLAAVKASGRAGAEVVAIPVADTFIMLAPPTLPWRNDLHGPEYQPPAPEPLPVRWPWEKD